MKKEGVKLKEIDKKVTMYFSVARKGKGWLQAKESLNCDCLNGEIRTQPGLAIFLSDNNTQTHCAIADLYDIVAVRGYNTTTGRNGRRFAYIIPAGVVYTQDHMSNGYTLTARCGIYVYSFSFKGKDNRTRLAVFGQERMIICDDTFAYTELGFQAACGAGCFYKDRVFAGVKSSGLIYSSPDDPTDFTETVNGGGKIQFTNTKGEIIAIIPFHGALYVFFERGIVRLDVGGSPKEFKAHAIDYAGADIIFRTVGVCESAIYFMTVEGVYRFDGEKVKPVFRDVVVPPVSRGGKEKAVTWRDGVLIRYRKRAEGDVVLSISGDGKECCYLQEISAMSNDPRDGLIVRKGAMLGKLDETGETLGLSYRFVAETDFETRGRKTLRKLTFEGEGAFVLTIKNGKRTIVKRLQFENGCAVLDLAERGDRYELVLEPQDKTVIRSVTAELRVLV